MMQVILVQQPAPKDQKLPVQLTLNLREKKEYQHKVKSVCISKFMAEGMNRTYKGEILAG
jgi:uncharacterized protein with von Willebrand factor type A (vWA) domain